MRIAVTGTRGKSGVTRLIAAGLRESGARVLAKTTGSAPVLIFPDGSEEEIPRSGSPSIREQVRVVSRAARMGADVLVTELMSISRECLFTESRRIVRPGILALTNVRLDHLDAMGRSKEAIADTLSAGFPEGAAIYLPAEEVYPAFTETASRLGSRLGRVEEKIHDGVDLACEKFESDVRLALAVLHSLGVDRGTAFRGMDRALPDCGSLRMWRAEFGTPPRPVYCVSAFAANDPESSAAALARVKSIAPPAAGPLVGLLCLREDRGDRTLQWVHAAGAGFFAGFERVAVLGRPAPAVRRKLRRLLGPEITKFSFFADPCVPDVMCHLVSLAGRGPVVVGLGNIIGHGEAFLRYWAEVGTPYAR